ncbi:MAG TPA: DMT family transporter [Bacteroidales bacterium]|nr:DMT family transporter [Bacteroidales bacterium]
MQFNHIGEISALMVAFFWTITALAFESASKKVGSLAVNLIRLFVGFFFLSCFTLFYRGHFFPDDAGVHQWLWLSASGLIGFVLGDLFLFKSFTIIGSRVAMLIMTLVPPITAALGYLFLGEKLTIFNLLGMTLTVAGICTTIFSRTSHGERLRFNLPIKGFLFALGGAGGQALGLVISKKGMGNYDPFAATQIRIITGMVGFAALVFYLRRLPQMTAALQNRTGMKGIIIGSFFGPFLGVSLSLFSVKYTNTGIASTIMAIVPILIIPPSIFILKQKVTIREIIGAVVSVVGIALFFIE